MDEYSIDWGAMLHSFLYIGIIIVIICAIVILIRNRKQALASQDAKLSEINNKLDQLIDKENKQDE